MKKDYLWNSIGTSINAFISLLLLIVVTRVNGLESAGLFSLGFGLSLVFFTISLYGGRVYQVSDIHNKFLSGTYIALKFITSIIATCAALSMILVNHYDTYKSWLIMVLVLYKISEAIADPLYGVIQRHNRLYIVGISLTFKGCVGFLCFLFIDMITGDILLSSVSLVVVNILFLLFFDLVNARRSESLTIRIGVIEKSIKNSLLLMKKSVYIFTFSFLTITIYNIPRYFIDIYHETDQGYFGILIMPGSFLSLLATFIMQPVILPLSEMHKNKQYDLFAKTTQRILLMVLGLGIIALIAVYLVGHQIMMLIYGIDLTPYRIELTGVILGGIFNVFSMIYSNVLVIIRKQFVQLPIFLFSLILVTVICMALVDTYRIDGGVWAYIVTNAAQAGLFIAVYHTIFRKKRSQIHR
jgi:O-antigen/teichoic acid export membrane protein